MKYHLHTLPNGLRYILAPKNDTQAFTLLALYKVGSRYEKKGLYGAAHYIEHLMFKGTEKRPATERISKELDAIGAEYNAFTSRDHTGYYIKTDGRHIELASDILSDMLWNSKFDAIEMEREKHVIVEEVKMYEENPLMRIDDIFEEQLFLPNQLGRVIAGEREDVLRYKRDEVLQFRNDYYRPNNMLVIAVGNIGENTGELIEKYFANTNVQKKALKTFKKFSLEQKKPRICIEKKDITQIQLALGFPAISYNDPRQYALKLLGVVLGGNMSSRLFITVRERNGLAYSVSAGSQPYEDTGYFVVMAGLDVERIDKALRLIVKELQKVKHSLVSQGELSKAREFIKGKTVLAHEDSGVVADFYGKQALFKKTILTPEEMFAKYDQVTREDLQKIANEIFLPEKLNIALIGPFENSKQFDGIEKFL